MRQCKTEHGINYTYTTILTSQVCRVSVFITETYASVWQRTVTIRCVTRCDATGGT